MIQNSKDSLREVVNNIMTEMFFIFPDMDDEGMPVEKHEADSDYIDVTIHYNDDALLYFRIEYGILSEMAANFLGLSPEDIDRDNLIAMACETANIIGGNHLVVVDPDQNYTLSIPEIPTEDQAIARENREWIISFTSENSAIIIWPQKRT